MLCLYSCFLQIEIVGGRDPSVEGLIVYRESLCSF